MIEAVRAAFETPVTFRVFRQWRLGANDGRQFPLWVEGGREHHARYRTSGDGSSKRTAVVSARGRSSPLIAHRELAASSHSMALENQALDDADEDDRPRRFIADELDPRKVWAGRP